VHVEANPRLTTLAFPEWAVLYAYPALEVWNNALLASVRIPKLANLTKLELKDNAVLDTLDAQALTRVGSYFTITGNPRFPSCRATALRDRVVAASMGFPPMILISGTDDAAVCN
jgi:hypothetical protein